MVAVRAQGVAALKAHDEDVGLPELLSIFEEFCLGRQWSSVDVEDDVAGFEAEPVEESAGGDAPKFEAAASAVNEMGGELAMGCEVGGGADDAREGAAIDAIRDIDRGRDARCVAGRWGGSRG